MTTPANTLPETLSNGLPPPPIPQRLREMLKDYPGHLERLQEALNSKFNGPKPVRGSTTWVFEEIVWALEGRLETFIREAQDELEAAQTNSDAETIAQIKERISLMRRARSGSNGMLNLSELREYVNRYQEFFQ